MCCLLSAIALKIRYAVICLGRARERESRGWEDIRRTLLQSFSHVNSKLGRQHTKAPLAAALSSFKSLPYPPSPWCPAVGRKWKSPKKTAGDRQEEDKRKGRFHDFLALKRKDKPIITSYCKTDVCGSIQNNLLWLWKVWTQESHFISRWDINVRWA